MITILNLKEKFPTNGLIKDCLYKECKQYIKGQEGYIKNVNNILKVKKVIMDYL